MIEKHPYSIWKGKEGLWHTYLPDAEKKRIHKRSSTRQGIEDIVVDYWKEQMENPTVKDVYEQWITGKLSREEISVATKNRYDRKFSECMEVFGRRKIKSVSEYEIEDFILNIIHEKNLTAKGYSNLRTLIYGIFKLAKKKKYIDFSITEVISDMESQEKHSKEISSRMRHWCFPRKKLTRLFSTLFLRSWILLISDSFWRLRRVSDLVSWPH